GFKASVVMDVNDSSHIGKSYLLPLFKPKVAYDPNNPSTYQAGVGNGSHYNYDIVQFVSVTITSDPGDNRNVYVTPSATVLSLEQIITSGQPTPGGQPGSTPMQTVFVAPRLSQ